MRALVLVAVLAALATPAAAYRATNGLTVDSTGPEDFVVNFYANRATTDYWCAAGDFVIRSLDLPRKTRIYRASPKPVGAGQGISFTLDPNGAAAGAGLSTFSSGSDGSVSAGHASGSFCNVVEPLFPFD